MTNHADTLRRDPAERLASPQHSLSADTSPVAVEGLRATRGTDVGGDGGAKSTAARKDVPRSDELAGPVQNQDGGSQAPQNDPAGGTVEVSAGVESAGVGRVERPVASPRSNGSQAGTQAPPVDTYWRDLILTLCIALLCALACPDVIDSVGGWL